MVKRRAVLSCLLTTLVTAGLLASPASARRDIRVGVGDQSLRMFDDPHFKALGLRQVRYFVPWNAIHETDQRLALRAWVKRARSAGMRPLIHMSTTTFAPKQAPRPSVAHYARDVGRLVRYLRGLGVRDFGTFNEANHKSEPTWDTPNHAALYFKAMYRAVHRHCSTRSCRVVALDVLDQPGVERYIRRFYDRLHTPIWLRRAKFIGIHNYSDVNRGGRAGTRTIIKEARRHNHQARFWFTETGGLVGFGKSFPCDPSSPASVAHAERRASTADRHVFELANTYRAVGVQRIYLYNWYGTDCAPRADQAGRAPDELTGFDSGLVRNDGTPRPGLARLEAALHGSFKR